MKRKFIHIVCSAFLLINLGLTQIVAGFLHEHASDEGKHTSLKEGTDSLQEGHALCKICKLNLFYELFFLATAIIKFLSGSTIEKFDFTYDFTFLFLNSATGRAPPALIQ